MFKFHMHKWEVVGEPHFVRGILECGGTFEKGWGFYSTEQDEILHGYTTISLRCEKCGVPSVRTVIGKWNQ